MEASIYRASGAHDAFVINIDCAAQDTMPPYTPARSKLHVEESTMAAREVDIRDNEYADAEANYKPQSVKFWLPLIGMYLCLFLVGLVSSIGPDLLFMD